MFRRKRSLCLLLLVTYVSIQSEIAAQDQSSIDLITREKVTLEDLAATKDYGSRVVSVANNSPAARAGLQVGDRILAVDGIRYYGYGEYGLICFASPKRREFYYVLE